VTEGYGLNRRIVDEAIEKDCTMILTCDNGIAAVDEIIYAMDQGLKVVVTDHHDVQDRIPSADAIVNYKQPDCGYPYQGLCGTGVAYKLIQALYETNKIPISEADELLEFVAIATVADVMELKGENRILVREGLKWLQHTKNIGLQALIEIHDLREKQLQTYHIGFVLGPCFNASGRLSTVHMSFDLLDAQDKETAEHMAEQLKALNDERKRLTKVNVEAAFQELDKTETAKKHIIIHLLEDCHESLAGIIAGRVKERFFRPVIIFTKGKDGIIKGSGRSIPAYNMFEECSKCKDLFSKFGGHPMAAGITMKEDDLPELKHRLNELSGLTEADFHKVIEIDAAMPVSYITEKLIGELAILEPIGNGNTKPVFAQSHFHINRISKRGINGNVLSFVLTDPKGIRIKAVLFGQTEDFEQFLVREFGEETLRYVYAGMSNKTDVSFTYYPFINEFNGQKSIEIQIGCYKVS
jgi:single-stranded-DNA-specific exonuclease